MLPWWIIAAEVLEAGTVRERSQCQGGDGRKGGILCGTLRVTMRTLYFSLSEMEPQEGSELGRDDTCFRCS